MDKTVARNAVAFLSRVDLKGAESVELVRVLQALEQIVNAPEPAIVKEQTPVPAQEN